MEARSDGNAQAPVTGAPDYQRASLGSGKKPHLKLGGVPHNGYRGEDGILLGGAYKEWTGQMAWLGACMDFRTVTIVVGRRAGKTSLDGFLVYEEGGQTEGPYTLGYVAQGHSQANDYYEMFLTDWSAANMVVRKKNHGQDRYVQLRPYGLNHGAKIWFWSGEEGAHDQARGKGLNRLIIDEPGFVPESALPTFFPMLMDRGGKALIHGTARPDGIGFGWFRREYRLGIDTTDSEGKPVPRDPDHYSFSAPSECNPFIPRASILADRKRLRSPMAPDVKTLDEMSEFDGVFVEDLGGVFENIKRVCCLAPISSSPNRWIYKDAEAGHNYVMGIDWARFLDSTVVSIFDIQTKEQVYLLAIPGNSLLYGSQMDEVHRLFNLYNKPQIVADERDAGSYLCEQMRFKYGDRVKGVKWSYGGEDDKSAYVTRGRDLFQHVGWKLMNVQAQVDEFTLYSKTPLPSRNGYKYEAPPGLHDDFVSAALFASSRLQFDWINRDTKVIESPDFSPEWFKERERQRQYHKGLATYVIGGP